MKFEVIVRALVHDSRRILIGRKRSDIPHPLRGCWHLVGGRLEYDEDPWKAVAREVREETGLEVKPIRIIDAYPEFLIWPEDSGIPSEYTLHLIFECIPLTSEIKAADDVEEVKWIYADKIKEYLTRDSLIKSAKLMEFIDALKTL